jgi:inosine-uridine nucleoside N-ribohydrolase
MFAYGKTRELHSDNKLMKKNVIFDTAPVMDDAMAILFAQASRKIDLLGITTVFGNATIENASRNTLYLKQRFAIIIFGIDPSN